MRSPWATPDDPRIAEAAADLAAAKSMTLDEARSAILKDAGPDLSDSERSSRAGGDPPAPRKQGRPRPDYDPRIDWPERHGRVHLP